MPGQVDYLALIGESHFLVGSTGGQVHLFSMNSQKLSKKLPTDDLSMVVHAVSPRAQRLAIGCEEGAVMIFDLNSHERVGTIKA
jgi:hypothetical protein